MKLITKRNKANIKYLDRCKYHCDRTSTSRTVNVPMRSRELQRTAGVVEQKGDFTQSKTLGSLLTLTELPKFLSTGGIKDLENTAFYKQNGYVLFYLDTLGIEIHDSCYGSCKFNPKGQTLQEIFKHVSESECRDLPFNERAHFWAIDHKKPLLAVLQADDGRTPPGTVKVFLTFNAYFGPSFVAPVVVVKQTEPKPEIANFIRQDGRK